MGAVDPEINSMVSNICERITSFGQKDILLALHYMWGGPKAGDEKTLQPFYQQVEKCKKKLDGRTLNNAPASRQFNEELKSRLVRSLPLHLQNAYAAQRGNAESRTSRQGGGKNWEALKARMQGWAVNAYKTDRKENLRAQETQSDVSKVELPASSSTDVATNPTHDDTSTKRKLGGVPAGIESSSIAESIAAIRSLPERYGNTNATVMRSDGSQVFC